MDMESAAPVQEAAVGEGVARTPAPEVPAGARAEEATVLHAWVGKVLWLTSGVLALFWLGLGAGFVALREGLWRPEAAALLHASGAGDWEAFGLVGSTLVLGAGLGLATLLALADMCGVARRGPARTG